MMGGEQLPGFSNLVTAGKVGPKLRVMAIVGMWGSEKRDICLLNDPLIGGIINSNSVYAYYVYGIILDIKKYETVFLPSRGF